jgi:hypothetical protein
VEVGGLSRHLTSLHLANCWTVWRQPGDPKGPPPAAKQQQQLVRLDGLRSLVLDNVCEWPAACAAELPGCRPLPMS